MKNILSFVAVFFIAISLNAQINTAEIPGQLTEYVQKYFPSATVMQYKSEMEFNGREYKVYLDNFTKLEFDTNYSLTDAENQSGLPEAILPAKVVDYVKTHYSNSKIVDWEKKRKKQEVELNNNLELEFDLEGNFLRIDD